MGLKKRGAELKWTAMKWLKQNHLHGLWAVSIGVIHRMSRNNLSLVAAGVAFYAMFAIFPALGALVSIYGLFGDTHMVQGQVQHVLDHLVHVVAGVLDALPVPGIGRVLFQQLDAANQRSEQVLLPGLRPFAPLGLHRGCP